MVKSLIIALLYLVDVDIQEVPGVVGVQAGPVLLNTRPGESAWRTATAPVAGSPDHRPDPGQRLLPDAQSGHQPGEEPVDRDGVLEEHQGLEHPGTEAAPGLQACY